MFNREETTETQEEYDIEEDVNAFSLVVKNSPRNSDKSRTIVFDALSSKVTEIQETLEGPVRTETGRSSSGSQGELTSSC